MNKFITFIKNHFGEIIVILGVALFIYNIFSFSFYSRYDLSRQFYYYEQSTLNMITLGATLLVLGVLIIKNRNESS